MKTISRFILALIATFALSVIFGAPTFAADSISISVGDSPSITLERNTLGTASVDVFVTSTAANGYTLSLTDSDEDNSLKSQFGDAINSLSASTTADNFSANSWGVKVGNSYLPVPKLSDEAVELYKSTTTAENEKTTVTFGMKVGDNLIGGAYTGSVVITATTNPITVKATTLKSGMDVNSVWKRISGSTTVQYQQYRYRDQTTTSIQRFTGEFTDALRASATDIAVAGSAYPVYTWYSNNTIYYYTEADLVYLNADSSYLFYQLEAATDIDMDFGTEVDVVPGNGPIFSTENVTDMNWMYGRDLKLASLDVSKWATGNVVNMSYIFNGLAAVPTLDVSKWNTSSATTMQGLFGGVKLATTFDVSKWDTSHVTNMSGMFNGCNALNDLDVSKLDTSQVTTFNGMFTGDFALESLDVSKWQTGNVRDMNTMFHNATALTSLDVSKWDVSSVTNMGSMFSYASSLTTLDVSRWDTKNVQFMFSMFAHTNIGNLDVSNWNTSNLTRTDGMFEENTGITSLNTSRWDTSKLQNASKMFKDTPNLTTVDVSLWNTESLQNMSYIINNATALTEFDVSGWNTSNVTSMAHAFNGASSITVLDVSGWDTSKVSSSGLGGIFSNASSLTTIYGTDQFVPSGVSTSMFKGSTSLVGGNGTRYNADRVSSNMAHIDVDGNPGYFTAK